MDDISHLSEEMPPTKRILGAAFFLAVGGGMGYWLLYLPLRMADHTGVLTYYVKAVLLPPLCFYVGIMMLLTDISNSKIRKLDEKGQPTLTRKGWFFIGGMFIAMALGVGAWELILRSHGFTMF